MYFVKYLTETNKTQIWFSVCQNGVWSEPQQAPFSSQTANDNNPRFGQSADTLFFLSQRPQSRIYRVVRTNGGAWSNPVALSLVIPGGKQLGLQFSMSKNGNIYSELSNSDGSNEEIYCWKKSNTSYQIPVLISGLSSVGFDGFPTIDAFERFILFSSDRNPDNDNFDIYISFRSPDNIWSEPINLSQGDAISQAQGWTSFSPDGAYLFFTRPGNLGYNPYWINAQFIYDMIPPRPYLDFTPPGLNPVRFGTPNLISNGTWWWISSPSFDSTGRECHFTKYLSNLTEDSHQIFFMKENQGMWSSPQQPNFISDSEECTPFFSEDNSKIYFVSDRDGSRKMYFVEKTKTGWSEAQLINFPYDQLPGSFGFGFSIASNNTIYFTVSDGSTLNDDLYKSIPVNGEYLTFEKLSNNVNSTYHDNNPFIAKDESYLIFASTRPGGFGSHDLYISFRKQDGTWVEAINMGSTINNIYEEFSPRVTSDGKYLFFCSAKPNVDYGYNPYWVDAGIIENYQEFLPYFGLTPPGTTPVKFATEYVSSPDHLEYGISFSPDGRECFFDRRENENPANLYYSKFDVNEWTAPVLSPISNGYFLSCEPCFSHDNKKLYFGWTDSTYSNINISFVTRTDNGWSEPVFSGQGMYISTDRNGNIYTGDLSSLPYNQYLAKVTEDSGVFTNYERLQIQPFYGQQAHPCIAPDGSYIIFDKWGEDLYVSFKKPNGTWNTAIRLSNHGFDVKAGGPRISPCGKYLFFHLHGDIWWVDIDVINQLNPYYGATVTDIDGNVYTTITIGSQIWMKQNLKVTRYNNGDLIPNITSNSEWANRTTGAYCFHENNPSYVSTYGLLYNFYAVGDERKLCPTGWHVPSDEEWIILTNFLGGEAIAGGKIKETGTTHWLSPNTGATNETGFTALPADHRNNLGNFGLIGEHTGWWTTTMEYSIASWMYYVFYNNGNLSKGLSDNVLGYSVRCLSDTGFSDIPRFVEPSFSVYPNPMMNELTIQTDITTPCVVKIYDISGTLVLEKNLSNAPASLNVSNIQPGIYIIELSNGKVHSQRKIVKQ